jgi:hypothetical protein
MCLHFGFRLTCDSATKDMKLLQNLLDCYKTKVKMCRNAKRLQQLVANSLDL